MVVIYSRQLFKSLSRIWLNSRIISLKPEAVNWESILD